MGALDEMNGRFGHGTLRPGAVPKSPSTTLADLI
jgi:hypothetical protein